MGIWPQSSLFNKTLVHNPSNIEYSLFFLSFKKYLFVFKFINAMQMFSGYDDMKGIGTVNDKNQPIGGSQAPVKIFNGFDRRTIFKSAKSQRSRCFVLRC